jgi:hypothetical protein
MLHIGRSRLTLLKGSKTKHAKKTRSRFFRGSEETGLWMESPSSREPN